VLNGIGYEKLSCIECRIADTRRSVDAIAKTNMKIGGKAVNAGDLIEIKDYADSSVWKGIRSKRLTDQLKAYAGAAADGNKVVLIFKTTIDPKHIDQLKRILGREGVTNLDIINGM
jgi:hypothetical protein